MSSKLSWMNACTASSTLTLHDHLLLSFWPLWSTSASSFVLLDCHTFEQATPNASKTSQTPGH
eukprot:5334691-Amphidinium_carterae.1